MNAAKLCGFAATAYLRRCVPSAAMTNGITKMLFCGEEFPAARILTTAYLEGRSGIEVAHVPRVRVKDVISDYHVLVPLMTRIDQSLIERASNCSLILQFGVGLEGVDVKSATERGVKVARVPSANCDNAGSTAEHAIYLALALLRKQNEMRQAVQDRLLGLPLGRSLFGLTVAIVGFGNIGREIAVRLRSWGVRTIGVRRSWGKVNGVASTGERDGPLSPDRKPELVDMEAEMGDLHAVLAKADVVILSCLLTPDTAGMVDDRFIHSMKKDAVLVNIARGGLLNYDSILPALESGRLNGLGIDVTWTEPIDPADPIVQHPRVIVTPHVGGVTESSYKGMAKIIGEAVEQLRDGKPFTRVEVVN